MHTYEPSAPRGSTSALVAAPGRALGAALPPGGALVGGNWVTTGLTSPVRDPEDGTIIGFVADVAPADVSSAVRGVAASVASQEWPLWERSAALHRAADLIVGSERRFARLIASEGVKTITEAIREVQRAVETLRLSAAAGDVLTGETIPFRATARGQGKIGWFTREPVGVVAALTSFNDPLNLVAHKVGPALIGGNGVVLKPSTYTPLTALALAEVLLEAGVPAGRLAVLPGGPETGHALVTHPLVDLISFTGGPTTAAKISAAAGARKLLMELGGNNPTIVCADADLDTAVSEIVAGAFGVAGQNCLSVQRVYVHQACFDRFVDAAVRATRTLAVGSKRDQATDMGPLISEAEARRVECWVAEAVGQGAVVRVGGIRSGVFVKPTILTGVKEGSTVLTQEIFGPVMSIIPFATLEEAVRGANDSTYALQAGVFTGSIDTGFQVAAELVAGAVIINGTSDFRVDSMPFGGFKSSGIGREGVRYAVEAMTEPKNVIVNLTSATPADAALNQG